MYVGYKHQTNHLLFYLSYKKNKTNANSVSTLISHCF